MDKARGRAAKESSPRAHNSAVRSGGTLSKTLTVAALFVIAAFLVYLALGSVTVPIPTILRELARGDAGDFSTDNGIIWRIRLPRALACALVGAILGTVGSAFQALFRNPLAEPTIIGVSSGAAFGGTTAIVLGLSLGFGRVGFACLGALLSLALVMAIAKRQGVVNVQTLLLGGVVTGSLLSGFTVLNLNLAGLDSGKVLYWLLGSTTPMYPAHVAILTGVLGLGFAVLYRQSRSINAYSVSEFMAERQGVDPRKLKNTVLFTGTLMTGAAVGLVGIIGFVGLVAPHIARRWVGNDMRRSLPLASLIGAGVLLVADILAQRLRPGVELPIGAITAVLGAPVLLWMLKKKG